MTRAVKENTSDADAHDSAVALLAAAADLGVGADEVRTITTGRRVGFNVPEEVFDAADLDSGDGDGGGGSAPHPQITAVLNGTYLGLEEGSGDSLGWSVDAEISAAGPAREVSLFLGGGTHTFQTGHGGLHEYVADVHSNGLIVRITDTATGDMAEGTWSWSGANADAPQFTLTLPAVV